VETEAPASTLTSSYRYFREEEMITRNPAVTLRRPKATYEPRTLVLKEKMSE